MPYRQGPVMLTKAEIRQMRDAAIRTGYLGVDRTHRAGTGENCSLRFCVDYQRLNL